MSSTISSRRAPPRRSREDVRRELGLADEALVLHPSNLRPPKRIDLLLEAAARVRPRDAFKLVILAGADFAPYRGTGAPARPGGPGDRAREGPDDGGLSAGGRPRACTPRTTKASAWPSSRGCALAARAWRPGSAESRKSWRTASAVCSSPAGDVDALAQAVQRLIGDPAARFLAWSGRPRAGAETVLRRPHRPALYRTLRAGLRPAA